MRDVVSFFLALRPTQWLKNLLLFTAITFNGQLFDALLFTKVFHGFVVFCFISSASYLINDIKDLPYDREHPIKKGRPIASGKVRRNTAIAGALLLTVAAFSIARNFSQSFLLLSLGFFALQLGYTFLLKRFAVFDILAIAFLFTIRGFAGEVLTGFHIPIWLILTIGFLALFVASSKRHAELLRAGPALSPRTRPALLSYRERLLDFYATTFATATVLSYAIFVFFEEPPAFNSYTRELLSFVFPLGLQRKWLILTFPFVLLGIMRYAQVVYEKRGGEAPERLITTDKLILLAIFGWGIIIITILYLI